MKKKSNWRTILATLIMVLPFVLGFGASNGIQASAAEGDATITIHKKKMLSLPADPEDPSKSKLIQNTGGLMSEFDDFAPLAGVEFTVYDVTEKFYELYTGETTQQDALDAVKDLDPTTLTKVDSGATDKDGELPFSNIPKKSGDHDAVYLIVETPQDGVAVAGNMVVAFPVYEMEKNEAGSYVYTDKELSTINLYPKNVVTTNGALQVTKKGTAEGELLNGAEFVISRIVDGETQYISGAKDGLYTWTPNKDEAQTFITGNSYTVGGNAIILTTGSKGVLNVAGLEVGDYTLIETKAPENAGMIDDQTKTDFTVTKDTTTDAPVALEIKNDTSKVEKTTPNLDGKDVEIGAPIDYQISTNIPLGIADKNEDGSNYYTVFTLTDTHSEFLTFVNDSKKYSLKMGDTVIDPANYTITEGENSFVVKINAEYIPSLTPGAQLVFDYQMYLNENATPDQGFDNTADVDTDHTSDTSDKVVVTTGGKKFVKKDVDTDKTLAGATFVVKNAEGKFLAIDETTKAISWMESQDDAKVKVFTTVEGGIIDIQGLEYGKYTLIETKAPEGYVTPEAPNNETPFTISKGSYTHGTIIPIPNKHKGSLPSTGGKGIVAFVAVGVVAIAGAGLYFMKGRKHIEG